MESNRNSDFDVSERVPPGFQEEPDNPNGVVFMLTLPSGLRKRARIKAIGDDASLSQILRDFLEAWTSGKTEQCPCKGQS